MRLFSGAFGYQPVWHPYVTNRWAAKLIRETLPALLSLVQFFYLETVIWYQSPGEIKPWMFIISDRSALKHLEALNQPWN